MNVFPEQMDWWKGKIGSPILVLACWPGPSAFSKANQRPTLLPERIWFFVRHQTAGVCCNQREFWATQLIPKDAAFLGMRRIEERWFGSNLGRGPWLHAIMEYESSLHNLFGSDVTCNLSFDLLEEGVYPIDLTRRTLTRLTSDPLVDLQYESRDDANHFWIFDQGCTLRLLLLGANSD